MKSKRSSHYCAKSQSPRSKGAVFYDLYRLLSRGMVDARQVLKIINVRRTVWHVDDLGDWHRTPDVARGSFTVKKAAAQLVRMIPNFELGQSSYDSSEPTEPEDWLDPRNVYGFPDFELHRLDLLQTSNSSHSSKNQLSGKTSTTNKRRSGPNQKNLIYPIAGALLLLTLDRNERLASEFSADGDHSRWRKRIVDMIKHETGLKGDDNRIVSALRLAFDGFLDTRVPTSTTSRQYSKEELLNSWSKARVAKAALQKA